MLWQSSHFPFIFFFNTEELDLTWNEFRDAIGYMSTFRPPGIFSRVTNPRLTGYDDVPAYVRYLREAHGSGGAFAPITSAELQGDWGEDAPTLREVDAEVDAIREQSVLPVPQLTGGLSPLAQTSWSLPRSVAFGRTIRKLYGERCAICGLGLHDPDGKPEVQSVHLYPKERDGADDYRNGICLCRLHHWALDAGWLAIADDHTIIVRDGLPSHPDYDCIRRYAGRRITVPTTFAPHPLFLRAHREYRGFPIEDTE